MFVGPVERNGGSPQPRDNRFVPVVFALLHGLTALKVIAGTVVVNWRFQAPELNLFDSAQEMC